MSQTLDILRSLVGINSVFPGEAMLSRYMQVLLRERGFSITEVTTDEDRPSFVATLGEASNYLAFYGHLDTVPPDPLYEFDPFTMRTDESNAYGLGVADMKGGNACILSAAFFAAERRIPVKVVFGVDEEDMSQGAHDLVSSGHLNDVSAMIVAEAGQIRNAQEPFSVGFGRKGRVLFEAIIRGASSHAAVATFESNAIHRGAAFVQMLETISFPAHASLGSTRLVPHSITAQASAFSAPGECHIRFSALTTPGVTSEMVSSAIRERARSLDISLELSTVTRPTPYGEAYEVPTSHRFARFITEQICEPANVTVNYFSSVADENVFAHRLGIPVVTLGPIGAGDHTKDEWVRISSLHRTTKAYEQILQEWQTR